MKKIIGFSLAAVFAFSFICVQVASADAEKGKKLFESKKCITCHDPEGDLTVFKPVGPGLKGVGKRHTREWMFKWLSPANIKIWESNDADIQAIKARYKAAKKLDMKRSMMVKNFQPRKGGKAPKIILTDEERNHILDFLLTL